jgi:hypothetical protein
VPARLTPEQLALQALSKVLADPVAKALYGSKDRPGVFQGTSQASKQGAQHCLSAGWLTATGQYEGKGKSRKELYRITEAGIRAVLDQSELATLLGDSVNYLERNVEQLASIATKVEETRQALRNQKEMVGKLQARLRPPDLKGLLHNLQRPSGGAEVTNSQPLDWLAAALEFLADYQRQNPYGHCPLPELFHRVGESRGLTIGQFHDGLRRLVQERRIRLHPFTGAAYQLQEEQYALVAGQEIKYYAEHLASA